MHVNLTATYLSLFACDVIINNKLIIAYSIYIYHIHLFHGTYEHITD